MGKQPISSIQIPTIWGHTDVSFYNSYLTIGQKPVSYVAIRNYSLMSTGLQVNFVPTNTSFEFHIWTETASYDLYWNTLPFNMGGKSRLLAFQQLNELLQRYALPKIIDTLLDLHKRGKPIEFKRCILESDSILLRDDWGQFNKSVFYRNIISTERRGTEFYILVRTDNDVESFMINKTDESAVLPILLESIRNINTS
jgi:hypothetical protein